MVGFLVNDCDLHSWVIHANVPLYITDQLIIVSIRTHTYSLLQIKSMISSRQLEYIEPSASSTSSSNTFHEEFQNMMKELTQSSMNFANDSMHTSLCLQFPPKIIAYACIYLGGQFCKLRPADKKQWLDILDLSMVDLASKFICCGCFVQCVCVCCFV